MKFKTLFSLFTRKHLLLILLLLSFSDHASAQQGVGTTQTLTFNSPTGYGGIGEFNNVKSITSGGASSLLVNQGGIVYAWGYNSHGQLGNGTIEDKLVPVKVSDGGGFINNGSDKVIAVATGGVHSLIATESGIVYAFGGNIFGGLGDGDWKRHNKLVPVKVSDGDGFVNDGRDKVIAVAAGSYHSLIATESGIVYAFGGNQYGQLGNWSTKESLTPNKVGMGGGFVNGGSDKVIAVAARDYHSLIATESGIVYAFGNNQYGQLGGSPKETSFSLPIPVMDGGGFVNGGSDKVIAVATGERHSLITTESGIVYAFGDNSLAQLGDGTTEERTGPVKVSDGGGFINNGSDKVIAVAAGMHHSLLATESGIVYAFGDNSLAQLGVRSTIQKLKPVKVSDGGGFINNGSDKVIAVAAGSLHSLIATQTRQIYAWGIYGSELGTGITTGSYSPTQGNICFTLTGRAATHSQTSATRYYSNVEVNVNQDASSVHLKKGTGSYQDITGKYGITIYTIGETAPFVVNNGEKAEFTIKVTLGSSSREYSFIIDKHNPLITKWKPSGASITIPTNSTRHTYNYNIEIWNEDGTSLLESKTGVTGNYTSTTNAVKTAGMVQVHIRGTFPHIYFNNAGDKDKIISVEQWGDIQWQSMEFAFCGCTNLTSVSGKSPLFADGGISCQSMFAGCSKFNSDLSGWDTSNVRYFTSMFKGASSFNQDISHFKINNLISADQMLDNSAMDSDNYDELLKAWATQADALSKNNIKFSAAGIQYCAGAYARKILINRGWGDGVKQTNETYSSDDDTGINDGGKTSGCPEAFITKWAPGGGSITIGAENLEDFDYDIKIYDKTATTLLESATVVTTEINELLPYYTSTQPAVANADTVLVYITGTFPAASFGRVGDGASKLISVEQWGDIKWIDLTFYGCTNLISVPTTAPPSVHENSPMSFSGMFRDCSKLNSDFSDWDVSDQYSLARMFEGCTEFNSDLSGWDTSNVRYFTSMFKGATSFNRDISHFKINNLISADQMLDNSAMDSDNYDELLKAWATQADALSKNNTKFSAVGVQYCAGADARRALIDLGWGDGRKQANETYSSDDGTGIDDGGSLSPTEIKVNSFRTKACQSSTIHLDNLVQYPSLPDKPIKWSIPTGGNTYSLAGHPVGDVVVLNYTVAEEYCGKDVIGKGTLYVEVLENITLENKSTKVCVYEVNDLNLNTILGVAVQGKWTALTLGADKHLTGSRFDGTSAYGSKTGNVEYEFLFETEDPACLTNTQATIKIVVTDEF
jgi:surface protein